MRLMYSLAVNLSSARSRWPQRRTGVLSSEVGLRWQPAANWLDVRALFLHICIVGTLLMAASSGMRAAGVRAWNWQALTMSAKYDTVSMVDYDYLQVSTWAAAKEHDSPHVDSVLLECHPEGEALRLHHTQTRR